MNNPDYVYYIKVDGSLLLEYTFSSEADAIEKAESLELSGYEIIEWDVD